MSMRISHTTYSMSCRQLMKIFWGYVAVFTNHPSRNLEDLWLRPCLLAVNRTLILPMKGKYTFGVCILTRGMSIPKLFFVFSRWKEWRSVLFSSGELHMDGRYSANSTSLCCEANIKEGSLRFCDVSYWRDIASVADLQALLR